MMELPQKRFYITRHGETPDNENGIASGSCRNPFLTKKGVQQAEEAAKIFKLLDPNPLRIIVTKLTRTWMTAKVITGKNLNLHYEIEEGLNERFLNNEDGKLTVAEQKLNGDLEGAESKNEHRERVLGSVAKHLHQSNDIPLFVTHGGTTRRVLEAVGMPSNMHIGNAQIYECVPVNGKWKVFELGVKENAQSGKQELKRMDITPAKNSGRAINAQN